MNNTFYDGHDELYHHAKFGEDRATRARCRCENVVFTGRIAVKRQTAGIKILTGQKSGYSPGRGDSLHRFMSNLAGSTGTWVRLLGCAKFHLSRPRGWECGPKNIKNFHFLVKSRPAGCMVRKCGVCFFCWSRSESGALCCRGVHSSNKHCVAVYPLISTLFTSFFRRDYAFRRTT